MSGHAPVVAGAAAKNGAAPSGKSKGGPSSPAQASAPAAATQALGQVVGLPRYLDAAALAGSGPAHQVQGPQGQAPVNVYDSSASRAAADRMGAYAFAYQGSIFMGRDPGFTGGPSRDEVLRHEMTHVLQSRRGGHAASRDAVEKQAHDGSSGAGGLLAADPDQPYPFLWVPFVIAFGYILLKPNTANAPGPNDKTYKSMDTADYFKMTAEAALFASGGAFAGAMRRAGYSVVSTWAASGAFGSMAYRGIQDVSAGSFSGIEAYVVDGITGAVIGVIVGGVFYGLGKVPGLNRVSNWFNRGAENDAAYGKLSAKDKLLYEIGQKTLASPEEFSTVANLSPVERGRLFVQQQGWARALFPKSGQFLPGGATFGTGPTPGGRMFFRGATGFGAGFAKDPALDAWKGMGTNGKPGSSVSMGPGPWAPGMMGMGDGMGSGVQDPWQGPPWDDSFGLGNGMDNGGMGGISPLLDPFGGMPGGTPVDMGMGTGSMGSVPTIVVVPQGQEMEYLIKTGKVGDFPVPDGTPGLNDYLPGVDGPLPDRKPQPGPAGGAGGVPVDDTASKMG